MATSTNLRLVTPDGNAPVLVHTDLKSLADQVDGKITRHRVVQNTAAGNLPPTWFSVAPAISVPADPFGAGVAYRLKAYGVVLASSPANAGIGVRIAVDGSSIQEAAGQVVSSVAALSFSPVGGTLISAAAAATAKTVELQARSESGQVVLLNNRPMWFNVEITPAVGF